MSTGEKVESVQEPRAPLPVSSVAPRTPKLDDSPPQFAGTSPAWVSGASDALTHRATPRLRSGTAAPHALPSLSQHALRSMPRSDGLTGIGISTPTAKHARAASTFMHSDQTSKTVDIHAPLDPAHQPGAPKLGVKAHGTFSPTRCPSPRGQLVDANHPDAFVPAPRLCMRLSQRSSFVPQHGDVIGLGITLPEADVTEHLPCLSLTSQPEHVLTERSANICAKDPPNFAAKTSATFPAKNQRDASNPKVLQHDLALFASSVTDENGVPLPPRAPTKRHSVSRVRRPRSISATLPGAMDSAQAVSHTSFCNANAQHGIPAHVAQRSQRMFHLR
ncbi:hypothetical protein MVES1_000378 [Malassezia vespertilionis]|uniref:Uncharacterized protein n=1 Tax=Malassezia vespertilionis TaxID=2020962 RepID=A0A2N1JH62_9BASI|nr:uncharacterized protein MVES1_000378 [Malassezia vespertilionis]PKI85877.1 hypothetical protein MVES_000358 [Malassezia vespertilionis]WFD05053.1 hypothetical protein MVES1_000378 [Malassezia vespertilionis]